jgi:hypothetical protein
MAGRRKTTRKSGRQAEAKAPVAGEAGSSVPPALSKSEFIRSRPPGMTAKQVVSAASAVGIKISEHFVYNIRSSAKKRAAKVGREARMQASSAKSARASSAAQAAQFRALVLDLGLAHARELLDEVQSRLSAVIAGR